MLKHQNSNKQPFMAEIIPARDLKLIPWEEEEKFLIVKRVKEKLILTGLRKYLRNIRREKGYKDRIGF